MTTFENLGDIETKIKYYTSEIEQKDRTIGELKESFNTKKAEYEALNKRLELINLQKSSVKKSDVPSEEILKKDEKIKELETQISNFKTQIDFANQESENLNQEMENLKKENINLRAQSTDQNELLEARKKIATLNSANSNLNLKIMSLEQTFNHYQRTSLNCKRAMPKNCYKRRMQN